MKHRVPRKEVLWAVAVLMLLPLHGSVLHTLINLGVWWSLVIAGLALVVTVKALLIAAHVRKHREDQRTRPTT